MCLVRTALKLRVCLCADEPRMIRKFDHFYDMSVWRQTGQEHAVIRQNLSVIVVYLITMSVTLVDVIGTI